MLKGFRLWWFDRFGYVLKRRECIVIAVMAVVASVITDWLIDSAVVGVLLVAFPLVVILLFPGLVRQLPWDEIEAIELEDTRKKAREELERLNGD